MKIEISDSKKWHQSFTIKMILLGILGVFLLVPLEMIKSIIRERQNTAEGVKKEIAFQWAGDQKITGPVLNIPIWIYPSGKDAESYKSVFHIMPENLKIEGDIKTEKRHRSIYKTAVYTGELVFSGNFIIPEVNQGERTEIMRNEAYYTVGISDNRGLKGSVILKCDSLSIEAVPGLKDTDLFKSGITFPGENTVKDNAVSFSMNITLSGSESLSFTPVGKKTMVNLRSSWKSPGFKGNFLPVARTIDDSGFVAEWFVTNLNRNFPQEWNGNSYSPEKDSFGVDFVLTVDHYQKSLRSAKYGILFIALTFLALLFAELAINEKIHIFHYLLVSLGLVLFFSLLNALSEHIGFNLAYLISGAATISLIALFLNTLLRNSRVMILISGLLVFLYSFIFVLLTLNDYAYLAGNIGLFILLAVTMRLSLKLNLFNREDRGGE